MKSTIAPYLTYHETQSTAASCDQRHITFNAEKTLDVHSRHLEFRLDNFDT